MKIWVPIVLSATFVAGLGIAPVAKADPFPPRPPGQPAPPGAPLPPRPPGVFPPAPPILPPNEYQTRMQRLQDERLAARLQARRDQAAWDRSRTQREADHRKQLEELWGAGFLRRPEVTPEMQLDADRCARIDRIIDLAQDAHDVASEQRARAILGREIARHARAMAALRARLGS